jgi:hypothetical protein
MSVGLRRAWLVMCATILGWIVLDFIEHKKISLGEAILIVLTIGPIIFASVSYLRRKFYAFAIDVSERAVPVGPTSLTIKLKARVPVTLERLNFRFVERRGLRWDFRNAPIEKVQIDRVSELDWRTLDNTAYVAASDSLGGIDVPYAKPKSWGEGEWLTATIAVTCHKPWSGYLSVEVRTTERRLFARRPFDVMEDGYLAGL